MIPNLKLFLSQKIQIQRCTRLEILNNEISRKYKLLVLFRLKIFTMTKNRTPRRETRMPLRHEQFSVWTD